MPHYNAYDSFKTKKSIEKKQRAKEKSFGKKSETLDNFIIDSFDEYGVVIEVRYDASIIKDSIDLMVDYQLDTQKQDNYEVKAKTSNNSIITIMETKNLECGKHL